MRYLDFDLQITLANPAGEYQARVLNSPAGQAERLFVLPFDEKDLRIFVLSVGRTRRGVRRLDSNEMRQARDFGSQLYRAIFQDGLQVCLLRSLDACDKQGCGLRLRLRLDPRLINIPWEYLYDTTFSRFFSHSLKTPIVRYLELPHHSEPLTVTLPLKVLVMIANAQDYQPLDVEAEWQRVKSAVAELEAKGLIQLTRLEAGTLSALQRKLRREQFHIFHFIGHAAFDEEQQEGILLLEDENQRGRKVSGHYLGTLLHDHASLRLAILNACEGARTAAADPFAGVAQHLVLQGIPAVIAMQFEITDHAAITLSREFYEALSDGYAVDAALAEARKAIFAAGNDVEWGTPVLYMRATDGALFEVEKSGKGAEWQSDSVIAQPQVIEKRTLQTAQAPEPSPVKLPPILQQLGIEMIRIPAGDFLYGDDKRKINLPEFWIAKTPITNQQYKAFVDATKHQAPDDWQNGNIPAGKENHPVVWVSWEDAQAFCKWAGVQLPSEQQWEKAARGTDGRIYPWGEQAPDRTLCNFNQNEGDTTPVDKYPVGVSPYGVVDMAGNVWEWCEDWGDDSKPRRVLRGGSYYSKANRIPTSARLGFHPSLRDYFRGFRCVFVPISR